MNMIIFDFKAFDKYAAIQNRKYKNTIQETN